MKKLLFLLLVLSGGYLAAQTDGLNYQAVILDPSIQELPGQDISNNILPNQDIELRFTILNANGTADYQEIQTAQTDAFGMVNVTIGQGNSTGAKGFTTISWDGTPKNLKVDFRFNGVFQTIENRSLNFLPFAFHRNITATGNLDVDGNTNFKGNLIVDGTTDLNNSFSVNNESPTNLTGVLIVGGATDLNSSLSVNNESPTNLTGTLNVDEATTLNATLDVDGATSLNNILDVTDATTLNNSLDVDGQTTLNNTLDVDNATTLNNTLDVVGATTLNNTLEVDGATHLNNTLEVQDNTTLNNNLLVTGQNPTTLTGTLTVDGVTNFNSDVAINNQSNLNVSGGLNVEGQTILNNDLTVNGITRLNDDLNVNNGSPTNLSGTLDVGNQTTLSSSLLVEGVSNIDNVLNVNNGSSTELSGTLTVGLPTNLNSDLNVNNGSPTKLSGSLTVQEETTLQDDVRIQGVTNFNNTLLVANGTTTLLSGTLRVDGATQLNDFITVDGISTFNNDLTIANNSLSRFTGTLEVDGASLLNNSLLINDGWGAVLSGSLNVELQTTINDNFTVTGSNSSILSGTLTVNNNSTLNNSLNVVGNTLFSGTLTTDLESTFNELTINNSSPTDLSGSLQVDGETVLSSNFTINAATQINNSLAVTGATSLNSFTAAGINIQSDNPNHVASFENTNNANGDGLLLKIGRTHGAFNGSFLNLPNPVATELSAPLQVLKNRLANANANPTLTVGEVIQLAPSQMRAATVNSINNTIFQEINNNLGSIVRFPSLNMPGRLLSNEIVFYGGNSRICSGQSCFSICFPFAGCTRVCVPPVNVCLPSIPRIAFPGINLPTIPIPTPGVPNPDNFIPMLPINLSINGLPTVNIPTIPTGNVSNSLTKENEYITFQDVDGRVTGRIRAQSVGDFADNTVFDDVYVLNVLSSFVGIDLLDGITAGIVEITNLIDAYNEIGVEYSSGNGDYAEWLERLHPEEYITTGDIVGVIGGKITRDLSNAEQIMAVSHRPIVAGNAPSENKEHLGNTVAFIGQVPVKVMGAVQKGDYIIAHPEFLGYGMAMAPENMSLDQFQKVVGRAWADNSKTGPKMVNTVVGVQNGDWSMEFNKIDKKQDQLQGELSTLELKLLEIEAKLNNVNSKEVSYARED